MSEIAPVTEPVATPAAPDFGAMQSIDEYRAARESAETPVETPAEPVEVKAEQEQPETQPDPASEAGKALAGKKKSLQSRIDELTREKHDSKREADAAKAELLAARAELAALKTPRPAAAPPSAQTEPTTPQPLTGTPKPTQAQFETYEEYIEALTEWKTEEKLSAARAQAQAQAASRDAEAALHSIYTRGRDAHADFDALLEQQAAAGVRWSPFVTQTVLRSENGHEIAYALAKDPETAQRISAIGNVAQAGIEMGKFLARLDAANSGPATVVAPVTQAPDPIKPVGGTSAGASTADPKNMNSVAAWREARKQYL
jgi:hypothetical protein